ncbi:MAG: hypothetical protein ACREV4_09640, partial [Gammaproteobacteria bacterium]
MKRAEISFFEWQKRFASDEACARFLVQERWPDGFSQCRERIGKDRLLGPQTTRGESGHLCLGDRLEHLHGQETGPLPARLTGHQHRRFTFS